MLARGKGSLVKVSSFLGSSGFVFFHATEESRGYWFLVLVLLSRERPPRYYAYNSNVSGILFIIYCLFLHKFSSKCKDVKQISCSRWEMLPLQFLSRNIEFSGIDALIDALFMPHEMLIIMP